MADMTRERALEVLQCSIDAWKICKATLSQEDLENETGNALRERAEAAEIGIAAIRREKERELQQLWKTCPQCGLEDLAYHVNCACCGNPMKDVPAHNGRMDEEAEHGE